MGAGAERVVVFVDYHNVHGWARRLFQPVNAHPAVGHVDPLRLGQLLVNRRPRTSALAGVRVYRGRRSPDHQARSAAANDRQTDAWTRSGLVTVIRRPLRYPSDWPDTPAAEKGIDVALAVDLARMAMTDQGLRRRDRDVLRHRPAPRHRNRLRSVTRPHRDRHLDRWAAPAVPRYPAAVVPLHHHRAVPRPGRHHRLQLVT